MRLAALLVLMFFLAGGCQEKTSPKPLDVPGQKLYNMRGKIVSREPHDNTIRLDHEAIPGFMDAMTMDYSVRGSSVTDLPPDGSRVVASLHAASDSYWLTNVKKVP